MTGGPARPGSGLTVVVPVRDGAATLLAQLTAIHEGATVDLEVLVADNGSTDGTREVVAAFARDHPGTRVVDASARAGVCHARNAGIAAASHEAVAVCDCDDVVAPGWADAMAAALAEDVFVGGPLEYDLLNPSWASQLRGRPMSTAFPTLEREGGPAWPFVFGANLGVRRSAHDAIGGFDESLTTGDDNDYAFRLWLHLGAAPVWVPQARVHYRLRTGNRELYRQARHYGGGLAHLVERYAAHWPRPPRARSLPERLARAAVRAARARDRAAVGGWFWALGWDAGYSRARRTAAAT